jgi:hypothetical protein
VDTFSANGVTLVSEPYPSNIHVVIDPNGNFVSWETSGVVENIVLPDGTIFHTAGRFSNLVWPPTGDFSVLPQFGSQGDVAAFCAAFS